MIKKILLIAGAAIGGIYLTSEEGKDARKNILKKKSFYEPIIRELLDQANEILEGKKYINSKEVKANIDLLVYDAKKTLIDLDLDKTVDTIKEAIRVASKKIRIAMNETDTKPKNSKKPSTSKKTSISKKSTNKKSLSAGKPKSKSVTKKQ
ncbi:MAG: hypothetical protein HRT99_02855 [Mycoplasmatales bacterium]|nr:hypothetical protein [Mycoplasmatales bacterium]